MKEAVNVQTLGALAGGAKPKKKAKLSAKERAALKAHGSYSFSALARGKGK